MVDEIVCKNENLKSDLTVELQDVEFMFQVHMEAEDGNHFSSTTWLNRGQAHLLMLYLQEHVEKLK